MDRQYFRSRLRSPSSVLVIGAGRSGIASARLLLKKGVHVYLVDDQPLEHLRFFKTCDLAHQANLTTHFGASWSGSLNDMAAVIVSPGVDHEHYLIKEAKIAGLPLLSEIDLASIFLPPHKMIGITGTNGKSTTTVMMESILKASGKKAIACGNLGIPVCNLVMDVNESEIDYLVVELSSFQLETMFLAKLDRAVIINITPDHLDRYPSFADYQQAKWKIAHLLNKDGQLAINEELGHTIPPHLGSTQQKLVYFSRKTFGQGHFDYLNDTKILGEHNRENAVAAAVVAESLAISQKHIVAGLQLYQPLPHRCEMVATINGISFINDSKGTTVVAVKKALSMHNQPTHLLLGGLAKGEDFSELHTDHYPQIVGYYVYGQAAPKILSELVSPLAHPCHDLHAALKLVQKNAKDGDVVLLSPGCASFDQFTDYHHRGETFKHLVSELY